MEVCTVKTLIRAAALKVFSRNFGQNLLNKISILLWLLFKGGSYLSVALINVITVHKGDKKVHPDHYSDLNSNKSSEIFTL